MVMAALIGAIIWNLITWRGGLPSSSSHALIGGLIGAVGADLGLGAVKWDVVVSKMIVPLVVSPILGFIFAYLLMLAIFWFFRDAGAAPANRGFRWAQILSAAFVGFSHGTNDAQKTMGIITLALISGHAYGNLTTAHFYVPIWVIYSSAGAISIGTYAEGGGSSAPWAPGSTRSSRRRDLPRRRLRPPSFRARVISAFR